MIFKLPFRESFDLKKGEGHQMKGQHEVNPHIPHELLLTSINLPVSHGKHLDNISFGKGIFLLKLF